MKKFFNNLFGTKSNQAKRTQRRQNTFRPQIEALEGRLLLARTPIFDAIPLEEIQYETANALRTLPGITDTMPVGETIMEVEAGTTDPTRVSEDTCNTLGEIANGFNELLNAAEEYSEEAAGLMEKKWDAINEAEDLGCFVVYNAVAPDAVGDLQFEMLWDDMLPEINDLQPIEPVGGSTVYVTIWDDPSDDADNDKACRAMGTLATSLLEAGRAAHAVGQAAEGNHLMDTGARVVTAAEENGCFVLRTAE